MRTRANTATVQPVSDARGLLRSATEPVSTRAGCLQFHKAGRTDKIQCNLGQPSKRPGRRGVWIELTLKASQSDYGPRKAESSRYLGRAGVGARSREPDGWIASDYELLEQVNGEWALDGHPTQPDQRDQEQCATTH